MSWIGVLGRLVPGTGGCCFCALLFWSLLVATPPLVLGPRVPGTPRNRQDLERGQVTATTAQIGLRLLESFQSWVEAEDAALPPLTELVRQDPIQLSTLLEEYGRTLYESGASRRDYAETINILVQEFAFLKPFLAGPWRLLTTWESLWPGKVHPPMPLPLLHALVSTALAWSWNRFALLLLIGFYALLRPCKLIALRVNDFMMSSETGCLSEVFIRLKLVKSRTRGAKMQNVRLDVPFVVSFLQKSLRTMSSNEKIWCYSTSLFRTRLQQTLFEVTGQSNICLPSSLRPGGATYFFRLWNEDLLRLQWRGRWLHFKTLAHYIQELGCINIMQELSTAARHKVHLLASLGESACKEACPEEDLVSQIQRLVDRFQQLPEFRK